MANGFKKDDVDVKALDKSLRRIFQMDPEDRKAFIYQAITETEAMLQFIANKNLYGSASSLFKDFEEIQGKFQTGEIESTALKTLLHMTDDDSLKVLMFVFTHLSATTNGLSQSIQEITAA